MHSADRNPTIRLDLTVRGVPHGKGLAGILGFADLAHERIVRGFAAMTTEAMWKRWRRAQ